MRWTSRTALSAGLISVLAAAPALSYADVDEGLLQRLFRLVRPSGKYDGRLSDVLAKATQRSGIANTLPRVLLVHGDTGESVEWIRGRGAVEPVVCPDGRTLVLRRGTRVERTEVTITNGQLVLPAAASAVSDVAVRQIFGCTPAPGEKGNSWQLWVENAAGQFQTLRFSGDTSSVGTLPDAFRSDSPGDTCLALRKLQGVRSDGVSAMVRDGRLVLEPPNGSRTVALPVRMPVTGTPAWLGDTGWLVVIGLQD
jgi:hypothetical protein